MDDQSPRVIIIICKYRLNLGRLVFPFCKGYIKDRPVNNPLHDLANKCNGYTYINEDICLCICPSLQIDEVQKSARRIVACIIPHRNHLRDTDLAIVIDILHVEACLKSNNTAQSGLYKGQPEGRLNPYLSAKGQLIFFFAAGDSPISKIEAIKCLPWITCLDSPLNTECIVAKSKVCSDRETSYDIDIDDNRTGSN